MKRIEASGVVVTAAIEVGGSGSEGASMAATRVSKRSSVMARQRSGVSA